LRFFIALGDTVALAIGGFQSRWGQFLRWHQTVGSKMVSGKTRSVKDDLAAEELEINGTFGSLLRWSYDENLFLIFCRK